MIRTDCTVCMCISAQHFRTEASSSPEEPLKESSATSISGENGFGYDPIFYASGIWHAASAELSPETEKRIKPQRKSPSNAMKEQLQEIHIGGVDDMKILIVSDTHGKDENLERVIEN